jgi:chromatin remodeling complex protein RSC6
MSKSSEQVSVNQADDVLQTTVLTSGGDAHEESTFDSVLSELSGNVSTLYSTIKSVREQLRTLERQHKRELKYSRKYRRTIAHSSDKENKKPSGFNKPCQVPTEIVELLKLDPAAEKSRTEITKLIYGYIKEHGLQDPVDKRTINPDNELRKLFKLGKKDQISFYNIQTHIKKVYPEKTTTEASSDVFGEAKEASVVVAAPEPVVVATPVVATPVAAEPVVEKKVHKSKDSRKSKKAPTVSAPVAVA